MCCVGSKAWGNESDASASVLSPAWAYVPRDLSEATLLSSWPDAKTRRVWVQAQRSVDIDALKDPALRLQHLFAREQMAFLGELSPHVDAARKGAPSTNMVTRDLAQSMAAANAWTQTSGSSPRSLAIKGFVLAAGPHADRARPLLEALLDAPHKRLDADTLAAVALTWSDLVQRHGDWSRIDERLSALPVSNQYQALIYLHLARAAQRRKHATDVERHLLDLFEIAAVNRASMSPVLRRDLINDLATITAGRAGGWERMIAALDSMPEHHPDIVPVVLKAYQTHGASPFHLAYLELYLAELAISGPRPQTPLEHWSNAVALAEGLADEGGMTLCQEVQDTLRPTAAWWTEHGTTPALATQARALLRRCLSMQVLVLRKKPDPDPLFDRYQAVLAEHPEILDASDHAWLGLLMHDRGLAEQRRAMVARSWEHLQHADLTQLDPEIRRRTATAMVRSRYARDRRDLFDPTICHARIPRPLTQPQRLLQASLETLQRERNLDPDARALVAEVQWVMALNTAHYDRVLPAGMAWLDRLGTRKQRLEALRFTVACLEEASQWSVLVDLTVAIDAHGLYDALDEALKDKLLAAHLHHADTLGAGGAWAESSKVLAELHGRWLGHPWPPMFLMRVAEHARAASDWNRARRFFEMVYVTHSQHALADDALMMAALLARDQGEVAQARSLFERLVDRYAGSPWIAQANDELSSLASTTPTGEQTL